MYSSTNGNKRQYNNYCTCAQAETTQEEEKKESQVKAYVKNRGSYR